MARYVFNVLFLLAVLNCIDAYWLMGAENFITTERLDPLVSPGRVSGHVHSVLGGSNFRLNTNTENLRQSECTSIPIPQDKSAYWFPHLYFQWGNGSFTSLNGGAVIYYLFSDKPGTTTAFPDDFRMLSGDPTLRTYDPNSYAQQAVTFLCLDFNGVTTRHNSLPAKACPSGIRAQINFPSCWDGKNLDSPNHKSHVAFPSGGPDSGTCNDPKYPVVIPRIFIEVYWGSNEFVNFRSQAKNSTQPFVYSYGDPTGYGYHADFINGWEKGVLQNAVDKCHCDIYGDPTCCVNQGIFGMKKGEQCRITKSIDETTTGTLPKLPGNNPVQKEGVPATMLTDPNVPTLLAPVYAYTGNTPPAIGKPINPPAPVSSSISSSAASTSSPVLPPASSSSAVVSSPSATSSSSSTGPKPSASVLPSPNTNIPVTIPSSTLLTSSPVLPSSSSIRPPSSPSGLPSIPHLTIVPTHISINPPHLSIPAYVSSIVFPTKPVPAMPPESTDDWCDDDDDGEPELGTSHSSPTHGPVPTQSTPSNPGPGSGPPSHDSSNSPPYHPLNPPHPAPSSSGPPHPGSGSSDSESGPDYFIQPVPTNDVKATTVTIGGAIPTGVAPPSSGPTCAGGKYRHQRLRARMTEDRRRSTVHHARSYHESARLFRRHHARLL